MSYLGMHRSLDQTHDTCNHAGDGHVFETAIAAFEISIISDVPPVPPVAPVGQIAIPKSDAQTTRLYSELSVGLLRSVKICSVVICQMCQGSVDMVIKQKNASLARRARMHELQRGMIDHDEAMWFLGFPMVFQWFLDVFGLDVGGYWRFHDVFHDVSMSHKIHVECSAQHRC